MKNLKKILLIGMVLTMFTACGKKNPTVSDNAADPTYVAPIVSINNTVSEPEATPATPVSVIETTISEDEPIEPVNDAGLHHVEIATLADQRDQLLSEASTLAVMEQVYDYNKQIAELNKKINDLIEQDSPRLYHGKMLYDQIVENGTTVTWTKEDYNCFVDYYKAKDFASYSKIVRKHHPKTVHNTLFLILYEIGKDDKDVRHIMGITQEAIRSTRFRINKNAKKA
jgi:hypothetical protein